MSPVKYSDSELSSKKGLHYKEIISSPSNFFLFREDPFRRDLESRKANRKSQSCLPCKMAENLPGVSSSLITSKSN